MTLAEWYVHWASELVLWVRCLTRTSSVIHVIHLYKKAYAVMTRRDRKFLENDDEHP